MIDAPVFNNHMPQFKRSAHNVLNDALREAARDTLVNARSTAPFKKGRLRAESIFDEVSPLHWRVSFWIEYARYQEFGGDTIRRVRNYSTPGTKAHFLRDAGDDQTKKLKATFRKHGTRARAR